VRRTTGIRVYLEGFRVVPYGEPRNDWLSLDADYTARVRTVKSLEGIPGLGGDPDSQAGLTAFPNDNYVGAVFLTEAGSPDLKTLVNREGFVPNDSYEHLVRIVRTGVDLSTRSRAAATEAERRTERERRAARVNDETARDRPTDIDTSSPSAPLVVQRRDALRGAVARATELGAEARTQTREGKVRAAGRTIEALEQQIAALDAAVTDFISEQSLLPVLASVGIQMARFVHEVNALLGLTRSVETALTRIRADEDVPPTARRALAAVLGNVTDLRHRLERQATYLVDVGSSAARRRRSRQRFTERFDSAVRLVEFAAAEREITIINRIPPELRSPPMFPAEITAIFTNLVTNAVKAAGDKGRIRARGQQTNDRVRLVIENTGIAVDPTRGERWFRPFESTTELVDPVLGQGLGLGLPITRALLEEYGGELRFTQPAKNYATAVEILLS
jgi:signal transduction histidine kinase